MISPSRGGFVIAAALCGAGCEHASDCDSIAVAALSVDVVDAAGLPVCNATVTARDGQYFEPLSCGPPQSECRCFGAYERVGQYDVTASAPGFTSQTVHVVVDRADDCGHPETKHVVIKLTV